MRHLIGVFPADEEEACDPAMPLAEQGLAISRAMEQVMQGCDAMIVNLTPFRGPSADVGSASEMGFMRALGRSIFGGLTLASATADTSSYHRRSNELQD